MPQIPNSCEFEIEPGHIRLETEVNGDVVEIKGMHLGREAAAALAYLVNTDVNLTIEIRTAT